MTTPAFDFTKDHATFAGCDMVVSMLFPNSKPIHVGECSTLSYSTFRDRVPVRPLGRIDPKGYTKGPRTVAGTLVFTVLDKHTVNRIKDQMEFMKGIGTILPDELPPFDLLISMANEYGASARIRIYGVSIHEEGMTMTTEDMFTENTWSFQARSIRPLDVVGPYEGDDLASTFILDDSEVPGRFILSDLVGTRESIDLRLAIEAYRKDQEKFLGDAMQIGTDYYEDRDAAGRLKVHIPENLLPFKEKVALEGQWNNADRHIILAVQILMPDGKAATINDLPVDSVRLVSSSGSDPLVPFDIYQQMAATDAGLPNIAGQGFDGYWISQHWNGYSTGQFQIGETGKTEYESMPLVQDPAEVARVSGPNGTGVYVAPKIPLLGKKTNVSNAMWRHPDCKIPKYGSTKVSGPDNGQMLTASPFKVMVFHASPESPLSGKQVRWNIAPIAGQKQASGDYPVGGLRKCGQSPTDRYGNLTFDVPFYQAVDLIESNTPFAVVAQYLEDRPGWWTGDDVVDTVYWYFNEQYVR